MYNVKKNNSGKWIIINDGAKRATKVFDSKSEAINYANAHYKGNYKVEDSKEQNSKSPTVNISVGKGKNKKSVKLPLGLAIILGILVIIFGLYYFGTFDGVLKSAGLDNFTAEVLFSKNQNNSNNNNNNGNNNNPSGSSAVTSEGVMYDNLQIHFLELGNDKAGDSVYIKAGDVDILIDAGSRGNSATTIETYINKYCTDGKLEYVIATHPHEDHIAAFAGTSDSKLKNFKGQSIDKSGIFYYYEIETLIDFAYADKDGTDNKTAKSSSYLNDKGQNLTVYGKYLEAREYAISNGTTYYSVKDLWNQKKVKYDLTADISMEILYNYYYTNVSSDVNNYSVCTMINYNGHHFMLTGDLEEDGEKKMASYYDNSTSEKTLPHVDLFKAGHHGSPTSSNECLLSKITPDICCVCCCAGTAEYTPTVDNQFPSQEFINRIAKYTDKVYVTSTIEYKNNEWVNTSLNGNITVSCNGTDIGVAATNNLTKLKDSNWFNETIYVIDGKNVTSKGKSDYYTKDTTGVTSRARRTWPSA